MIARAQDLAKNIAQDMAQDMAHDIAQDIAHEKILDKAKIMIKDGLDIDLVSKYTDISVKELKNLK